MQKTLQLFDNHEVAPTGTRMATVCDLFTTDSVIEEPVPEPPCAVVFQEDKIQWAMQNLPISEAVLHLLVTGIIGSGKTLTLRLLLQSVAERFRPGWKRPEQLIIFDGKGDIVSVLAGLGLGPDEVNVYLLNAFDERGAVWCISEAVQEPAMARHLATLLVPEEKGSNAPFFPDGGREIVYAVIMALNHVHGTKWTFRDLLCALSSRENIAAITARHPRASEIAQRILKDEKHSDGIISTIGVKLGKFEQVAALFHSSRSKRVFTIEKFLKEPGVLILGNDPVLKDSLWPLNAILLKALTDEILRGPDSNKPTRWFILDEFRAMMQVPCIADLLNRGRSKGVSVTLGIQSYEGICEVYGETGASEILGQCATKTFLRAGSAKTAEWAEHTFGKVRHIEASCSESSGASGSSRSIQYSIQERSILLSSAFLDIPMPTINGDFVAISDVPCLESTVITRRPFQDVIRMLKPPKEGVPNCIRRSDVKEQTLWPWTPEEYRHFCGPVESGSGAGASKSNNEGRNHPPLPGRQKPNTGASQGEFQF